MFPAQEAPKPQPVASLKELFETEQSRFDKEQIHQIQMWQVQFPDREFCSASKIYSILGGAIHQINDITQIGDFVASETAEANRCVDQVVSDFAALKPKLEGPKTMALEAISLIEGASKPQGWFQRLAGSKEPVDWAKIRVQVQEKTQQSLQASTVSLSYHVQPFIDGLNSAIETLNSVSKSINNTIDSLDYVIQMGPTPEIQDMARRRKEMFVKSLTLMDININQMKDMRKICDQNKHFVQELQLNIVPLIQNIVRSSVIKDVAGDGLQDIATKLKEIL